MKLKTHTESTLVTAPGSVGENFVGLEAGDTYQDAEVYTLDGGTTRFVEVSAQTSPNSISFFSCEPPSHSAS